MRLVKKIAIVGGGTPGLATACCLEQQSDDMTDVSLMETAPSPGGDTTSSHEEGFVVEGGPDLFMTKKPSALKLCLALGLNDQLIGSKRARCRVNAWSNGRSHPGVHLDGVDYHGSGNPDCIRSAAKFSEKIGTKTMRQHFLNLDTPDSVSLIAQ